MQAHKTRGFTLIELMIVVAVIGALAVLASTNYSKYGFRSRRSEGQQYITQIAAAEERFFTANNIYTTDIAGPAPGGLGFGVNTSRPNGYYTVTANLPTTTSYTLTAAPAGAQASDACGSLTLDNVGIKTPLPTSPLNSNGKCW